MNKGRKEERKQWQVAAVRDLPYNDPEISDIFAQRGRQPERHEKIMPPIVLGELCPCVCVDKRQACFSFRPLFPLKLHC